MTNSCPKGHELGSQTGCTEPRCLVRRMESAHGHERRVEIATDAIGPLNARLDEWSLRALGAEQDAHQVREELRRVREYIASETFRKKLMRVLHGSFRGAVKDHAADERYRSSILKRMVGQVVGLLKNDAFAGTAGLREDPGDCGDRWPAAPEGGDTASGYVPGVEGPDAKSSTTAGVADPPVPTLNPDAQHG